MTAPLLDVCGLHTHFDTEEGVVKAVRDISFQVWPGETLGVVGESGCGKSITGLSVMRLLPEPPARIAGGQIRFMGRDLLKLSTEEMRQVRGRDISMIFQDPITSLNPVLTVGRQIEESLSLHLGLTGRQARERSIELLRMVGIPNPEQRIGEFPHQLSGGMRQRIMIAIALACAPKLVIADEPTTALDVTIQAQILDLMRKLQAEHQLGLVMITHSMGVIAGIADRVMVMYAGQVVESGPTDEIFADPRHPYTIGLMRSIPRLDARDRQALQAIPGRPPELLDPPDICHFASRCSHAKAVCCESRPPLAEVTPTHRSACWFWQEMSLDRSKSPLAETMP